MASALQDLMEVPEEWGVPVILLCAGDRRPRAPRERLECLRPAGTWMACPSSYCAGRSPLTFLEVH